MKVKIDELIEVYSNMILQIAYQNLFNKSDAEDVAQEVFIKLINTLDKLKNNEHIKAWLIRVTINLSKDYNKSFWNKNTTAIDEELKYFDEENQEVFKELSKLNPDYRNIIYLYYYQGYRIAEISEILSMNQNTVSSYLTRARKEFKNILEDGGETYA
ncbi:MAG: sigma-70 family RNA polymerase sigma factor [Clostridia bacterium]|nr:sigma-70 family RNA polymerase sigma factor [Clostridia bacterium]